MRELEKIEKLIDKGSIEKKEYIDAQRNNLKDAEAALERYKRQADVALEKANEPEYLEACELARKAEDSIRFYETVIKDAEKKPVIDNPTEIASKIAEIRLSIFEDALRIAAHDLANLDRKISAYDAEIKRCNALEKKAIDCSSVKAKELPFEQHQKIVAVLRATGLLEKTALSDYWPTK